MQIRFASIHDLPGIVSLLESERLIHADLTSSRVIVLVAEEANAIVGCVGLETYGTSAIIRSAMVAGHHRNKGVARTLVERMEAIAASGGVQALFLLTERTEQFWQRMGYCVVERTAAPEEIRNSAEFTSLCPSTALCMMLEPRDGMRR